MVESKTSKTPLNAILPSSSRQLAPARFVLVFASVTFQGRSVDILSVVPTAGMACSTLVGAAGVNSGREVLALCGRQHAATWRDYQPDLGNPSIAPRRVDCQPIADLHNCCLLHGRTWLFLSGAAVPTMA